MPVRVLLVDTPAPRRSAVESRLLREGHEVRFVGSSQLTERPEPPPDVVVVDPDDLSSRERLASWSSDIVLVDPGSPAELADRIRRWFPLPRELRLSGALVALSEGIVRRDDDEISLTTREVELLTFLAAHAGTSFSREELLTTVWGYRPGNASRAVTNTVYRLRRKVEADPATPRSLQTAGAGYRLVLEEVAEPSVVSVAPVSLPPGLDHGRAIAPARTPSGLLRSAHETVRFVGRSDELAALARWLDEPTEVSICLVWGAGGVGKTRLAQELMRTRRAEGWDAGFLGSSALVRDLLMRGAPTSPLLVGVDYAETRSPQIVDLLREAVSAQRRGEGPNRVRVLLLARSPGEWWASLRDADGAAPDILSGSPSPIELTALDASTHRRELWEAAWSSLATHPLLGLPAAPPCPPLPQALDDGALGRPLYLQMAALVLLVEQGGEHGEATVDDLLSRVLAHEVRYWHRALELESGRRWPIDQISSRLLPLLAALVLHGGATPVQLEGLRPCLSPRIPAELQWGVVERLYPGVAPGSVRPLEPDLLGEFLVDRAVTADPGLLDRVLAVPELPAAHALTVLTRHAARLGDRRLLDAALEGRIATLGPPAVAVAVETGAPIAEALEQALVLEGPTLDVPTLERLHAPLPGLRQTVVLSAFAVKLAELRLARAPTDWMQQIRRTGELGNRLADAGRFEEAAAAMERAESLVLAQGLPTDEETRSLLVRVLTNLSSILSRAGRRRDALKPLQRVLPVVRALCQSNPATYRPMLANVLNNLGHVRSELGDYEDALVAGRESVEIRRALAASDQAALPALATGLANFTVRLGEVGRWEEARAAAEESLAIRRDLARESPSLYRPPVASSLNNLGQILVEVGRFEEALARLEEAVELYRELWVESPSFASRLSNALTNLGVVLVAVGQPDRAVSVAEDAVALMRSVVPPSAGHQLARALGYLADAWSAAGDPTTAREISAEALQMLVEPLRIYGKGIHFVAETIVATSVRLGVAELVPDDLAEAERLLAEAEEGAAADIRAQTASDRSSTTDL